MMRSGTAPGRNTPVFTVLLVVIGGVLSAPIVVAEPMWYASDPDMIRRDPIGSSPIEEVHWAVSVERDAPGARRTEETVSLYRYGEYRGGERLYLDADGLPRVRERFDAEEQTLFTEEFRRRSDGSIREVYRCDGDGACVSHRYGPVAAGSDEYVDRGELVEIRRFDDAGRPVYTRREEPAGAPVREEWFEYDDSGLAERRVLAGDIRETYRYTDGRITFEERRQGRRVVASVSRRFDDDDRLIELSAVENGVERTERWDYERDGGYTMERRVAGIPVVTEERDGAGNGSTTRYRNGVPVIREYYRDDAIYRREILSDGEVIRVEEP
ncbi:MAG: hypothetical protein ACLFSV_09130 [Alkalispirochaeta sp.]